MPHAILLIVAAINMHRSRSSKVSKLSATLVHHAQYLPQYLLKSKGCISIYLSNIISKEDIDTGREERLKPTAGGVAGG